MSTQEPVGAPKRQLRTTTLVAVATGVAYGLIFRWLFGRKELEGLFGVMSFAFLFLVPLVIGYLTIWIGERDGPWPWALRIPLPWLTSFAALGSALLLAWEGWICILLWAPLFVVESTVGALLAVLTRHLARRARARRAVATAVVLLPLLAGPVEKLWTPPVEIRTVATSVDIAAPPAVVWPLIARVRPFEEAEQRFSLAHWIGFPRPVEATLSREGVGGVRHASFEGGVVFVETITAWEPDAHLAFDIAADPTSIPMQTLDEHVTVGGPYFDVLSGDYRIEPLASGGIRLHLASRHRLSTTVNPYARLWTDFIMADVQRTILAMIKRRAEVA